MQIDANLVNDYLDYKNGTDKADRLGPERACSQGWITPRAMLCGIVLVTLAACATGYPLIYWGGLWMIVIGVACVIGCFIYSLLFSRIALGDLLVILFFGIVPVCATFYLQVHPLHPQIPITQYPLSILQAGLAMGLVTDCLLLVNNYRDRDTDRHAGRQTLVTKIGPKATEWTYLLFGVIAVVLCFSRSFLVVLYLPLHIFNWRQMVYYHEGRILNAVLSKTALAIILFALLYSIGRVLEICLPPM